MEAFFWLMLLLVGFTYLLYPGIVFVLAAFTRRRRMVTTMPEYPTATVIVSVFNEESILPKKLENLAQTDYPGQKISFLFGSDGSTDSTIEILQRSSLPGARVIPFPTRRGKVSVLNDLVSEASGEIVVFSDANTMFHPDTIRKLIQHFDDPSVGGVSGELKLDAHPTAVTGLGETSYWNYENWLKRIESKFSTILGATGGVYAIRKNLYQSLPTSKPITDDFLIPLNIVKQGYRVEYEEEAIAVEKGADSVVAEFRRKARIGGQNFNTISEFSSLLHPRHGFVSFALWSHKIIRWCVPFLIIGLIITSLFLVGEGKDYAWFLWSCLIFGGVAFLGAVLERWKLSIWFLTFPYYFLAMNLALLVGFLKFLFGLQRPTWEVDRRM
jgi:cellulose synthase/poly-beta-1,6-N-acetylglucosamine synthase-like glycosyltransferase